MVFLLDDFVTSIHVKTYFLNFKINVYFNKCKDRIA